MEQYVKETSQSLKTRVGTNPVLLLISGGVDSTVVAALLLKTLNSEQVHLMYIDTGLMRKNETSAVRSILEKLGAKNIHVVMAEDEFLSALKGKPEPEEKRRVIGDMFITVQEREVARLGLGSDYFLAQGSIRADFIESGLTTCSANGQPSHLEGTGKSNVLKSHHNIASPLVIAKREAGRVIEPLASLYKNEVRELGRFLGVDDELVNRHPFPGPGLAVRVLGEVTKEKCDILREADAIYIEELKTRRGPSGKTLYDEIWQAFAVLLPIRSVGVSGHAPSPVSGVSGSADSALSSAGSNTNSASNIERKYSRVLALRAITSADGMTANVYPFEIRDLLEISARITNSVKEIGRVTYDISNKPPATIEWE